MYVATTVVFDRDDRRILQRANIHLRIGFPEIGEARNAPGYRAATSPRIVIGLSQGDKHTGTPRGLLTAVETYNTLERRCIEDSEFWSLERERVLAKIEAGETGRGVVADMQRSGGIGLVADPVRACQYLVDIRKAQALDAAAARELVREALALVPAAELAAAYDAKNEED